MSFDKIFDLTAGVCLYFFNIQHFVTVLVTSGEGDKEN